MRAETTEEDGVIAARGNWGRWGAEDERGTLNLLTPETVLDAVRSVRSGRVYALGAPVGREGVPVFGFRPGPQRVTLYDERDDIMGDAVPPGVGATEDIVSFASHHSTHIDALCHVHDGEVIYNGHPQSGLRPFTGAERCGVQSIGGFAARGVLIDLVGDGDVLAPGDVVGVEDVQRVLARQGTELRTGDAILLRTGWLETVLADPDGAGEPGPQPGIGLELAQWLGAHDPAAVGADNMAVEAIPLPSGALGPHVELLVNRGVHLMENLVLAELAADGCHEFLLVVSPVLVTGATGSPVNPIAIA